MKNVEISKNKQLVAIGKIICDTAGSSWNIPHTHFTVYQTPSGLFEATNIQLVLDSVGSTIDEAARLLVRLTADYIKEIMIKGRGHDELIELVDTDSMDNYWRDYRKAEIELSKTGQDMGHKLDRRIFEAIKETWDDEFKDIIYNTAKNEAEKVLAALRDKIPATKIAVSAEYRELKAA